MWARYRSGRQRCGEIPAPPRARRVGPLLSALRSLARDRCAWRELGYFVALIPVSVVTGAGVALAWAVPLTLVALPGYYDRLPRGHAVLGPVSVDGFGESLVVSVAAVLFGVFVSPVLVRALAALDAALGRALLAPPRDLELTERVVQLPSGRDLLLAAVEAERKRIERDLHDGAQQRLVAVAMQVRPGFSTSGAGRGRQERHRRAHSLKAGKRQVKNPPPLRGSPRPRGRSSP
ncbi:sensor domain-containing protein [Streptomyces sp. NPDC054797]